MRRLRYFSVSLWLESWWMLARRRFYWAYDAVMIKFWPYDRWPNEWKDVFGRKSG